MLIEGNHISAPVMKISQWYRIYIFLKEITFETLI